MLKLPNVQFQPEVLPHLQAASIYCYPTRISRKRVQNQTPGALPDLPAARPSQLMAASSDCSARNAGVTHGCSLALSDPVTKSLPVLEKHPARHHCSPAPLLPSWSQPPSSLLLDIPVRVLQAKRTNRCTGVGGGRQAGKDFKKLLCRRRGAGQAAGWDPGKSQPESARRLWADPCLLEEVSLRSVQVFN